jgi:hypothetical protein
MTCLYTNLRGALGWAAFTLIILSGLTTGRAEPVNDCLIVAAKAQSELRANTWNRLLVVHYEKRGLQHVYLVYAEPSGIVSFDSIHGTQHFHVEEREASVLARTVDPFAAWGWYVEENVHNRIVQH